MARQIDVIFHYPENLTKLDFIKAKQTNSGIATVEDVFKDYKTNFGLKSIIGLEMPDEDGVLYKVYQIRVITDSGEEFKFNTSSTPFIDSMMEMLEDLCEELKDHTLYFSIDQLPSKNFKEKFYYLARLADVV